jgi:uncharacterized membrane protein
MRNQRRIGALLHHGDDRMSLEYSGSRAMNNRVKKLIGTMMLVALVVVYALAATTFATYRLAQSSAWVHLAFFAISGMIWILPAMWLISWMERKTRD